MPNVPVERRAAGRNEQRSHSAAAGTSARTPGWASSRKQFNFTLELHRDVEGELCHPYRTSSVGALVRAEDLDDEVGEAIDDRGLLVEARGRVDHSENACPRSNSIQVAELTLQAAEYRQRSQSCRGIGLFQRYVAPDLAERLRKRAICVGWPVTGDHRSCTNDPDPREWQDDAWRKLERRRERKAEVYQSLVNFGHD